MHPNQNELNEIWYKRKTGKATETYRSVLTPSEVRDFEKMYNIELPIDYFLFLTQIGNGGPGPIHHQIKRKN